MRQERGTGTVTFQHPAALNDLRGWPAGAGQAVTTSRSWMIPAADLVVDTAGQIPSAVAHQIAGAVSGL
jgi:hypothetical protein